MLNYHRETALQGALVLAKIEKPELGDNILRTLCLYVYTGIFNHCDMIDLRSYRILWGKNAK